MPIDRDVLEAVREMDAHELRRLLILAKARLEARGETFPGAAPEVSLRQQLVKCGKASCRSCPHGPYWYAYWTENGRRRSKYVGKLHDVEGDLANTSQKVVDQAQ
ncbi:MAG: hypothetical protein KJN71_01115 [Acidimicrobiia bacterium]|nr:hypothetical protein [Acidimicrobiia bacterium]NNC74419.1 hypothetical protein [Acidimicrobiia bacterium]